MGWLKKLITLFKRAKMSPEPQESKQQIHEADEEIAAQPQGKNQIHGTDL